MERLRRIESFDRVLHEVLWGVLMIRNLSFSESESVISWHGLSSFRLHALTSHFFEGSGSVTFKPATCPNIQAYKA